MSLNVQPGDCFRIWAGSSIPHYFFVISAPDRHPEAPMVIVPMTSASADKNIDASCLLSPGDHHTCTRHSFIDYRRAVKVGIKGLESLILRREAEAKPPPASSELLDRLRRGAEESEFLTGEIFELLYNQGLVRPL